MYLYGVRITFRPTHTRTRAWVCLQEGVIPHLQLYIYPGFVASTRYLNVSGPTFSAIVFLWRKRVNALHAQTTAARQTGPSSHTWIATTTVLLVPHLSSCRATALVSAKTQFVNSFAQGSIIDANAVTKILTHLLVTTSARRYSLIAHWQLQLPAPHADAGLAIARACPARGHFHLAI